MGFKISDNISMLKSQTAQRASIFLRLACDQVVTEAKPNTPKDKGNLRMDILKTVLGLHGTLEWRKGYASYQERGMRADGSRKVKHYTTPGTGPHFAVNAIDKTIENTGIVAKLAHLI